MPDGVFVADGAAARFVPLPPRTDDDGAAVCARAARRIRRLLDDDDELSDDDHGTDALLLDAARAPLAPAAALVLLDARPRRRTVTIDDFTLHADVPADDRAALVRPVRYGARPPFAHRRLRRTASGKVAYRGRSS